jgi:nitrite reductase/ring-hydroxylating ferredoxin subunit
MTWQKVIRLADLQKVQKHVFKHGPKQVLLWETHGKIFALDNRCPHQGYPLKEGMLDGEGCVLTCNWHNWKFDVNTGKCVSGGDRVGVYPTKIDQGEVWVQFVQPPQDEIKHTLLAEFQQAFHKRKYGRMSRCVAKLHIQGLDPSTTLVLPALEWSYDKLEDGFTHAHAALADWLSLYDFFKEDAEGQVICITEALDHLASDCESHETFPYKAEETRRSPPIESIDDLPAAIEAENEAMAIGCLENALSKHVSYESLELLLTQAALSHYQDFGHSLIYVQKTSELVHRLGPESIKPLVFPLIRALVGATREDLLPEFKSYGPMLETMRFPVSPAHSADETLLQRSLVGSSVKTVCEWVSQVWGQQNPEVIYAKLLTSLAQALLVFDERLVFHVDKPVQFNVGWLDFTHGITFAHAVRSQCRKFPQFWDRGLLQMGCFLGRNKPFMDVEQSPEPWRVTDESGFWAEVHDQILDHGMASPVMAAHVLKTSLAVKEEIAWGVPDLCKTTLLAGLNRFLHAKHKGKHVRRAARQNMALVAKDFV